MPTGQVGSPKRDNLGAFGCQFCAVISTPRRKGFWGTFLQDKVVKWKAWREYFGDCSGSALKSGNCVPSVVGAQFSGYWIIGISMLLETFSDTFSRAHADVAFVCFWSNFGHHLDSTWKQFG